MKKRILVLLLAALILLGGCGNVDDSVQDQIYDELSDYYQTEQEDAPAPLTSFVLPCLQGQTLDPITCLDGAQQTLGSLLYEGLFALDPQFVPQPMLAKSYTYDPETFTYIITLRSGVVFSDNTPLTAQDVVDTLQRARHSERYEARLAEVISLTAQGNSVLIRLKSDNRAFVARLDIPIVKSGTEGYPVPVGTGPYRYQTDTGGITYLKARSKWWQEEKLPLERIELLQVKDDDTMAYAFYAREVQLITRNLTTAGVTGVTGTSGSGNFTDADTTIMQYIGINTNRKPLDDAAVRRALGLGIDRVSCVNAFLMGHGIAAQFPVSPASPLYPANAEIAYSPDNYAQALEKAGLNTGETQTLTLLVNDDNAYKVTMAQKIAADLSLYDLAISVTVLPWDDYRAALRRGQYDLYLGECKMTADWDMSPFLAHNGALNYAGFFDKSTSDFLQRYLIADEDHRQSSMQYLCQKVENQAPILPICFKRTSVMLTAGAVDAITPTTANPFYDLAHWQIDLKK